MRISTNNIDNKDINRESDIDFSANFKTYQLSKEDEEIQRKINIQAQEELNDNKPADYQKQNRIEGGLDDSEIKEVEQKSESRAAKKSSTVYYTANDTFNDGSNL